jgi:hypothetical protein
MLARQAHQFNEGNPDSARGETTEAPLSVSAESEVARLSGAYPGRLEARLFALAVALG